MTMTRSITHFFATCGIFFVLTSSETRGQDATSPTKTTNSVETAVQQLAEGGKALIEARTKLSQLPAEDVVPAICNALKHDPRFQDSLPKRREAFFILQAKRAYTTDLGRETLIAGLQDPGVRVICAMLLGNAPPESFEKVIPALGKFLSDENAKAPMLSQVLRSLRRFGPSANAYLDQIEKLLLDSQSDVSMRSEAAAAAVLIGGIEGRIEQFETLDEEGRHAALSAIGQIVKFLAKETSNATPNDRTKVRRFVLNHLSSENQDIRQLSIQLCLYGLGRQLRLPEPENETAYREIREALQTTVDSEPDMELKEMARGVLQELEKAKADLDE